MTKIRKNYLTGDTVNIHERTAQSFDPVPPIVIQSSTLHKYTYHRVSRTKGSTQNLLSYLTDESTIESNPDLLSCLTSSSSGSQRNVRVVLFLVCHFITLKSPQIIPSISHEILRSKQYESNQSSSNKS